MGVLEGGGGSVNDKFQHQWISAADKLLLSDDGMNGLAGGGKIEKVYHLS